MPRGAQVERDGFAITVGRRGTSSGIALRLLSCSWVHVQSAKDHTGGETAHRGIGPEIRLSGQSGLKLPRGPHTSSHSNYIWGHLGINNCSGPISWLPFRHWGNLLCAYWSPWSTFFLIHYCNMTVWMSQTLLFQLSSQLQLGLCAVFHMSFWSCQSLPHPFRGGIYWARSMPLFSWYGDLYFSPINWTKCKP